MKTPGRRDARGAARFPTISRPPCYRLTIEYDGTRYHGWQEQKNARTVAGEVRAAAEKVAGRVTDLGGSGRTDRGVHALAQVAHLRTEKGVPPPRLKEGMNDLLPPDINLLSVDTAPARWHARHDAAARAYLYQFSRRRTAFARKFVWWVQAPLDTALMRAAAAQLPGRHDFKRFCEAPASQKSTIVVVEGVELVEAGDLILLRLTASHFLWKMVRRLAGALAKVGTGERKAGDIRALLEGKSDLNPAEWTAPPSGLFLERVLYPGDAPLAPPVPAVPIAAARG